MRILYHHRTAGEEPESVHIANIVRSLRKAGHEVDIIGPAPLANAPVAGPPSRLVRVKQQMPRWLVELLQVGYNLRSFLQLRRALKAGRYDFIYERHALYNFSGLLASRWSGLPLILEVNTLYAEAWAKYYGLAFARLARWLEIATIRRADHLITVTEVQRAMLVSRGVANHAITVSHNAVDPEEFSPTSHPCDELRAQLQLRPIVVGFVGTMNRWQGVQGFVDVVSAVVAQRQDVSFLFVGEGERRARLEEELRNRELLPYVVFAGRQPHSRIARFVSAMSIGVLLDSNAYGSPMKIFEYWAMGKAVIAPRVAPVVEILQDGQNGLLIEPGDAAAMAAHILRLAADPALRGALGAAGRRRVLEQHTWDNNAAQILTAYRDCARVLAQESA